MKTKTMGAMSIAIHMLLTTHASPNRVQQVSGMSLNKVQNNELVDMSSMGQKISTLSLSMLNKQQEDSEETRPPPTENEMLLTESHVDSNSVLFEEVFSKVYNRKDEIGDSDILAFSAVNADTQKADDDLAFSSGGAIMDALVQKDPTLGLDKDDLQVDQTSFNTKQLKKKTKEIKKIKIKSKAQLAAEAKQKEKDKLEEEAEVEKQQKLLIEQETEKKVVEADKANREQQMLANFMEGDQISAKEQEGQKDDYFAVRMKSSKSIFEMANTNIKEQSLSETAANIVDKAKKTVFKGLMGGMDF